MKAPDTFDDIIVGAGSAGIPLAVRLSADPNRRVALHAVTSGARLLLADYWTDPTHTEPVIAAMMAGEFALNIEHGDVYSTEEAREWLAGTGWRFVTQEPLNGPKSVIVAEAA